MITSKKFFSLLVLALFLPPQAAQAYGDNEIAEALVYSGCTFGLGPNAKRVGMDLSLVSSMGLSLQYRIIDEGVNRGSFESNDTPFGRRGHQHRLQSWVTAGVLNSKWESLEPTYEKGILVGLSKWKSGAATIGDSTYAAGLVSRAKLTALCRVAEIAVSSKAKRAKMPIRQYIIKVAGKYLPPLP
jgi:hypothetical protein